MKNPFSLVLLFVFLTCLVYGTSMILYNTLNLVIVTPHWVYDIITILMALFYTLMICKFGYRFIRVAIKKKSTGKKHR